MPPGDRIGAGAGAGAGASAGARDGAGDGDGVRDRDGDGDGVRDRDGAGDGDDVRDGARTVAFATIGIYVVRRACAPTWPACACTTASAGSNVKLATEETTKSRHSAAKEGVVDRAKK